MLNKNLIDIFKIGYRLDKKVLLLAPLVAFVTLIELVGIGLLITVLSGLVGDKPLLSGVAEIFPEYFSLNLLSDELVLLSITIIFFAKYLLLVIQNYYIISIPYHNAVILTQELLGIFYNNIERHFLRENKSIILRFLYNDVKEFCGKILIVATQLLVETVFVIAFCLALLAAYPLFVFVLLFVSASVAALFYYYTHNINRNFGLKRRYYEQIVLSNIHFISTYWRFLASAGFYQIIRQAFYSSYSLYNRYSVYIAVQPLFIRGTLEFVVVLVVLMVTYYQLQVKSTDPAFIIFLGVGLFRIIPGLARIMTHLATISQSSELIERLRSLLNERGDIYPYFNSFGGDKTSNETICSIQSGRFFFRGTDRSLSIPSFTIEERGLTIVRGPSGSGKSTLIDILMSYESLSTGIIHYNFEATVGGRFKRPPELNDRREPAFRTNTPNEFIALLPQVSPDYENYSDLFFELGCVSGFVDQSQFKYYSQRLGIGDLVDRFISRGLVNARREKVSISVGELQRMLLCYILALNRKVIILDEPTSAQDNLNQSKMYKLIEECALNRSVVMISHDASYYSPTARIFTITEGVLVANDG